MDPMGMDTAIEDVVWTNASEQFNRPVTETSTE